MNEPFFRKVVNVGKLPTWRKHSSSVFFGIELRDNKEGPVLSITGVVGPYKSGNAAGGCEQIIMEFKEYDDRGHYSIDDLILNDDWNKEMVKKFFDIWSRWHLNDLHAGCIHQENHIRNLEDLGVKMVYPETWFKNADLLNFKYCEECDYHYGHGWKYEPLPEDVIDFLKILPDTKITPAWV